MMVLLTTGTFLAGVVSRRGIIMRVAYYGLRVSRYGLRFSRYGLRVAG
jgi:hypothetical protein